MTDELVRRLAELHGIAPRWRDVWDEERSVGIDTLTALLRGLDVPADNASDLETSLREAEMHRYPSHLPRRICANMGERCTIELALPANVSPPGLEWRLLDADGKQHGARVPPEAKEKVPATGLRRVRWQFAAPEAIGHGEIRLQSDSAEHSAFAVSPPRCFEAFHGRKSWGSAVQLAGLRSPGDCGIGHYDGLAQLTKALARQGADAIAVSPVHALFTADAGHFSPYSPSNRRFLNGILANPQAWLPSGTGNASDTLESAPIIDWMRAMPERRNALKTAWRRFSEAHLSSPDALGDAFRTFRAEGAEALENHARFETLHSHFFNSDPGLWDWRSWPSALQSPASQEVAAFAREHAEEVSFHAFLQWLSDRQLGAAQQAAREAGMSIGIIADLAVGTHPGGSRAWSEPDALLRGITIGAPPDLLGPMGQDWGVTIFSPTALHRSGYESFLGDLRTAMKFGGGIRLDHIMGLQRLWCVPAGAAASEGAYIEMPWRDMMRLVALESHRHRCLVIGEDLGTVPEGFRDELRERNVLGIQVLWFERAADGGFHAPDRYSDASIATTSTHDLATLAGWWIGRDLDWRARAGQMRENEAEARAHRARERAALWQLLRQQGLVPQEGELPAELDQGTAAAIAALLARTAAPLVLIPLEDLLLQEEQPNLPGTVGEHPNWCRRAGSADGNFLSHDPAAAIVSALRSSGRRSR